MKFTKLNVRLLTIQLSLILFLVSGIILAQEKYSKNVEVTDESASNTVRLVVLSEEQLETAFQNLMVGINSENEGVRLSSIYMCGELRLNQAVIPLLKILKSDEPERFRIAAANSLFKINDPRGIFIISRLSELEENQSVKNHCLLLVSNSSILKNLSISSIH